jgi:transposase
MHSAAANPARKSPQTADLSAAQLQDLAQSQARLITAQAEQIAALKHQLDWFRRQIFGQKSERFEDLASPQLSFGEGMVTGSEEALTVAVPVSPIVAAATPTTATATAPRRARPAAEGEELPFFDESKVPVQTITLLPELVEGLGTDEYVVIGQKVTYRVARRPGSYQVIKTIRPTVKVKATGQIDTVPAPEGIFDGASRADVSFAAGLLVDKFQWHLPLYRQHQRMQADGLRVSRPWLTQVSQQAIALLEPIHAAQLASICAGRVKAMDETPIKAGKSGHGKLHTGYFWPVYGEQDEVCFPFHASRSADFVGRALGLTQAPGSVLLTDGYAAYARYAKQTGVTHAQCWAHARRAVFEAEASAPEAVHDVLAHIQQIYAVEEDIRARNLAGEAKREHRLLHSQLLVERLFGWIDRHLQQHGLKPATPFTKALVYIRERRDELCVFLNDPDVPLDTNHLERALRVIPMGRKNWLFCWTELGAKHVGIVQSLLVTCKLQGIDPTTYLIDVLQRVATHPASRVAELTPRRWKTLFADNPLRSEIHDLPL